jgi:hypothetical protein
MKKLTFIIASFALLMGTVPAFAKVALKNDITSQIPVLNTEVAGFDKIENVAQYKNADWSQVIGIAKNVKLSKVAKIANEQYPETTYFFYVKGGQMVLETEDGNYRVFHHGDAVFFKGTPWWGSAPGLADGYVRQGS